MKMYRKNHKFFFSWYRSSFPSHLFLAFVVGNVWWNLDVHSIQNAVNVFLIGNANLFRKNEPPTLKHGAYYDQIQGQISFTKRKWCILYIFTYNGTFQETTMFNKVFVMLVSLEFYFHHSFALSTEIHSRSLQTLLILESWNVQSRKSIILNKMIELRDRSIYRDFCKLWHHFHCVGITYKHAKCLTTWHCKNMT